MSEYTKNHKSLSEKRILKQKASKVMVLRCPMTILVMLCLQHANSDLVKSARQEIEESLLTSSSGGRGFDHRPSQT